MTQPRLVISTRSWHYKYFIAIRSLWGVTERPTQMSLCPYCQTMFWLSVISVMAAPFFILGILAAAIIKVLGWIGEACFTDHMIERFERTEVITRINRTMDEMEESPLWTAFAMGMGLLVVGFLITALVGLFTYGVSAFISIIPQIPGAIWTAILWAGCGCFHVCGLIGWVLNWCWGHIAAFFTNGPLLLIIAKWAGIVASGLVSLAALCYLGYLALNSRYGTPIVQGIRNWFQYMRDRRENRRIARIARMEGVETPAIVVEERGGIRVLLYKIGVVLLYVPKKIWGFFFSRRINVGEGVYKILSPVAVLISLFWAIKHRVCPIVEVLNPTELETRRQQALLEAEQQALLEAEQQAAAEQEEQAATEEQEVEVEVEQEENLVQN